MEETIFVAIALDGESTPAVGTEHITTKEEATQRINLLEDLILYNEEENRVALEEIDNLQYLIDNDELE